jgi:hypothetical protein
MRMISLIFFTKKGRPGNGLLGNRRKRRHERFWRSQTKIMVTFGRIVPTPYLCHTAPYFVMKNTKNQTLIQVGREYLVTPF